MRLDFPVVALVLSLAACLEEFLPGFPLPPPCLAAASVYYSLRRPFPVAGTVALLAGLLHDALGGVPAPASPLALFAFAAVARALRTVVVRDSAWTAAAAGAIIGLLLPPWQRLFLGAAQESPRGAAWVAGAALASSAACAAAAPLFFLLGRKLDTLAGNIKPRKEIDGREWPPASV